jgi:hypothetical protein
VPKAAAPPPQDTEIVLSPVFKWAFTSVVALTTSCLIATILMTWLITHPTDQAKDAINTVSTAFKMGFGAIVGLIGGKAIQ